MIHALQEALTGRIAILLLQEPWTIRHERKGLQENWKRWLSKDGRSAIICYNPQIHPVTVAVLDSAVAIQIALQGLEMVLISAYSSPLEDLEYVFLNHKSSHVLIGAGIYSHQPQ